MYSQPQLTVLSQMTNVHPLLTAIFSHKLCHFFSFHMDNSSSVKQSPSHRSNHRECKNNRRRQSFDYDEDGKCYGPKDLNDYSTLELIKIRKNVVNLANIAKVLIDLTLAIRGDCYGFNLYLQPIKHNSQEIVNGYLLLEYNDFWIPDFFEFCDMIPLFQSNQPMSLEQFIKQLFESSRRFTMYFTELYNLPFSKSFIIMLFKKWHLPTLQQINNFCVWFSRTYDHVFL